MTDLFACAPFGRVSVFVDGQAEIASAFISSGNYYEILGVTARTGRTILPEDDRPTAPPVAVISSSTGIRASAPIPRSSARRSRSTTCRSRSSASSRRSSPACSSRSPSRRKFPSRSLSTHSSPSAPVNDPPRLSHPTYWWLQVMGRLKPGVSPRRCRAISKGCSSTRHVAASRRT